MVKSAGTNAGVSNSYSGGVKTTRTTAVGSGSSAPTEGTIEQVSDNLYKTVTVAKASATWANESVSYSGGVKKASSTTVGATSSTPSEGSVEQVGDSLYRRNVITTSAGTNAGVSNSFSGGVQTTRTTAVGSSSSAPTEGTIEQVSASLYKTVTVDKASATWANESVSYSGGIKKTSSATVGSVSSTPAEGSVEQVSPSLYRRNVITTSAGTSANESVSYSRGVKNSKSTTITSATAAPSLGSIEQVSASLYKITTITPTAADYKNVAIGLSGKVQTTRTTSVETSTPTIASGDEGTYEQVSDSVWIKTDVDRADSGLTVGSKDVSGGLITERTVTTGSGSGTTPSHGSVRGVASDLHELTTVTESADTGFSETSWSRAGNYQRRKDVVSIVTSLGSPADGEYERYDQLGDAVYRKTITTFEDDNFTDGTATEIGKTETYKTGIKYTTIRSIGAKKSPDNGFEVFYGESENSAGQTIYETTHAEADGQDHTVYDMTSMEVPGLLDVTADGLKVTPPVTRPVHIYTDVSYSTTAGSATVGYSPPTASVDWTINLKGTAKDYVRSISSSNSYYQQTPTTEDFDVDQPTTSSSFHEFKGHGIETSTLETTGSAPPGNESGSCIDYRSTPILITSGGTIYRNETIYLNENFTYS